jgi:toxin-antitoxin system PIN domain toxin
MILLDVNVLVYAHREDLPEHPTNKRFLEGLIGGESPFGVPEMAFSSVIRIVTQNAFKPPSTLEQAIGFCDAVMSAPNCLVLRPTDNHWRIFERICRASRARGKVVADAYLAAFAIDRDDEWVTTDKDFSKFPGLRWRHPTDAHARTNPR